ncbi:DNA segregation ATPase FtsK/SpoIIIE, S-DNA-T family [Reichenbachiella faecimaris]|uniref:DNA segregation ATPase FtsK/SpoIIIE, S-DNA-T family n=1 Tax=Reichenbachiella faecimaris TaxID=692418 RepID=A0A1W2GAJ6_REIFA|nr:DNA translocase FtsK [Reichenbachiella faecimaris]SMD33687.1 DNA segregation ATPase FtsK/SpoIIIE, S-DNA-T family [Reichenbachiella faecimaris]
MAKNTFKSKTKEKRQFRLPSISIGFLNDRRFHLSLGFLTLISSLFLLTAFISYLFTGKADQSLMGNIVETGLKASGLEAENWLGLFGAYTAHYFIYQFFGIASFLIPPFLFLIGYKIVFDREILPISKSFWFTIFFLLWISVFIGYFMINSEQINIWGFLGGGTGFELAILLDSLMGWGTLLFLLFALAVFTVYFFNITKLVGLSGIPSLDSRLDHLAEDEDKYDSEEDEGKPDDSDTIAAVVSAIKEEVEKEEAEAESNQSDQSDEWKVEVKKPAVKQVEKPELVLDVDEPTAKKEPVSQNEPAVPIIEKEDDLALEVEKPEAKEKVTDKLENYDPTLDLAKYVYPTPDLLTEYPEKNVQVSKEELEQNKDNIVETLINFKIGISSIKATIGPTVTLYEIVPEAGVKISKIKNLEDDIALSLAALGIRIIAPIPGKGTIGIEVPNKNREMVDVKSILTTDKFMKSSAELPVVLGKTISNEVYVTDLAKMPHLLMAGATGQGKSVGLNILLTSLIYKKHPSQLKFVLVDPKKVELTLFNKIEKHFLAMLPGTEEAIITDTKKVIYTLNSLCIEMDNRYDLLKNAGCRNLKEYNKKFVERKLNPNKGHKFLPYIVLVIDELADLMMTAGKEVETPIARLAQLARAIGIHLVVATQRPSVNVITGVIKANFPARLSFRVTSKIDSRTILDAGGAEQLVGMGDMLLSLGSDIIRLQCGFVDTPEVDRICEFVGDQQGYESAYMLPEYVGDEGDSTIGEVDLKDRDVLFEDAARLIVMHQQGSTSLVQRKLKLGYNRAGRLIDQLEAAGIVGAFEGSKAREVLVTDEHSLEQLLNELNGL